MKEHEDLNDDYDWFKQSELYFENIKGEIRIWSARKLRKSLDFYKNLEKFYKMYWQIHFGML